MTEPLGTSIRIFLVDGTPEGVRIVEKSNWTGQAIVCSRSQYPDVRGRPEFDRPGVYVLTGPSEEGPKPALYIGEADVVRSRVDQHLKTKDFWTRVVAFTAKDLNLNKAHIRYLESRLLELASQARQWTIDNGNFPQAPSLSEADRADAEAFLQEMLVIYPVLGIDAFEVRRLTQEAQTDLYLRGKDAEGRGVDEPEGFVVFAGSRARVDVVDSIHAYLVDLRQELVEEGILRPAGDAQFELTQDYRFNSPSQAAGVLLGRKANGRVEWKNRDGVTLKELQEAAVDE